MPRKHISPIDTANKIRPLLSEAKKAYGSQAPGSPARNASESVNKYLLDFVEEGGRIPDLAACLSDDISISGLRRRVRIARGSDTSAMEGQEQVVGKVKRPRGRTDPDDIQKAAVAIQLAREEGGRAYGDAVRDAYNSGLSLGAIAEKIGISYYSLWSAKRTSW